jgi:hypothetical protein
VAYVYLAVAFDEFYNKDIVRALCRWKKAGRKTTTLSHRCAHISLHSFTPNLTSIASVSEPASDPDLHISVESSAESDRPPLWVKLTGYRLLFMTVILVFGTVKIVPALRGSTIASTGLDWVLGVVLGIGCVKILFVSSEMRLTAV